ncbi:MAG: hypothetical protein ACYSXF_07785 [Planctomycetota bacterium]|jgi:hypothetical protein
MRLLRRWLLPLGVFAAVVLVHFIWSGFFPERDPAQDRWLSVDSASPSWLHSYVEAQRYWLGYAYALPVAFAAAAWRRYRELRLCGARNLAMGGVTLSGFLSVAGCFLVGCCGSPMLGVYLSLFGAAFLPFTKPLIATITTLFIVASYLWMRRRIRALESAASVECAAG